MNTRGDVFYFAVSTDNTLLSWDQIDIEKFLAIEYRIFRPPEIVQ